MNSEQQLVSIIVITYNSAEFVLKTLESIASQTYANIELIIADDCSVDGTVKLCRSWLDENIFHFVRTELVTVETNTGIAPNCNRAIRKAAGEWVKIIAGDDELLPDCIAANMLFVKNNRAAKFVFSNMIKFRDDHGQKIFYEKFPLESHKPFFNTDAQTQYNNLITDNLVCPAPASFIHKESLINVGMFNENFPFIEDYPLWLKCTLQGYPLYYFDKDTALYRKGESLTQTRGYWRNKLFHSSVVKHFAADIAKNLRAHNKAFYYAKKLYFFKLDILLNVFQNKINFLSKSFNFFFDLLLLNPLLRLSQKRIIPTYHIPLTISEKSRCGSDRL